MFKECIDKMRQVCKNTYVIECAFGTQDFVFTNERSAFDIRVRSKDYMWVKENLINICVRKFPPDWKYVCWIDPGVEFLNENWVEDCIKELKKTKVIQLFHECLIMGEDKHPSHKALGFVYQYVKSAYSPRWLMKKLEEISAGPMKGIAWATTREIYEQIGGLYELAIMGGGEQIMVDSFVVNENATLLGKEALVDKWEKGTKEVIRGSTGYLNDTIKLYKIDLITEQAIVEQKGRLLKKYKFEPLKSLKENSWGVYEFTKEAEEFGNKLKADFKVEDQTK